MDGPRLAAAQPAHGELLAWLEARLQAERRELEQSHAELLRGLGARLAGPQPPGVAAAQLHLERALSGRAAPETKVLASRLKTTEDFPALDLVAVPGKPDEPTVEEAGQCLKGVRPAWTVLDRSHTKMQNFITDDVPVTLIQVPDPRRTSRCLRPLEQLVASRRFEAAVVVLVLLYTAITAAEVQHQGAAQGPALGLPGRRRSSGADTAFEVLGRIFAVVFFIEMLMRFAAMQGSFVLLPQWKQERHRQAAGGPVRRRLRGACRFLLHVDWWNLLDVVSVLAGLTAALAGSSLPLDPMTLRLARIGRLMRILRLVRTIQGFDALYLLTTTLKGSMQALFWSAALLLVIQLLSALAMNQLLQEYYTDTTRPLEQRQAVYKYFGTFTRALFTASELTLGGYGTMARTLIEHVSEWWAIFFILHRGAVGFAIVTVIRGVIITETLRVAAQDDVVLLSHKTTAKELHRQKMERLFALVDADGSDIIEVDEFRRACKNPVLQTWLQSLELDVRDADMVYKAIAGPDSDCLTKTDLILGMAKLKGPARSMEMAIFKEEMRDMMRDIHISLVHNKLVT